MASASKQLLGLAAVLASLHASSAQQRSETVWGSVVVTTFGDRIPLLSPAYSVLTPVGAQEMYDAGSYFNARYMNGSQEMTNIAGLSTPQIDTTQTWSFSVSDVWIQQSAQAFMNGLYPPLGLSNFTNTTVSSLADNKTVSGPLNGLQYANILTYDTTSPNRTFLDGITGCNGYAETVREAYTSQGTFQEIQSSFQPFYNTLDDGVFASAIPGSAIDYANAYEVWDFFSYEIEHNTTIAHSNSYPALNEARYLADQFATATVGNAQGPALLTVAGRTLSAQLLTLLVQNNETAAANFKLNLLFTSWEPLMSLAALLDLPSVYPEFLGMPNVGSSMVFELFSENEDMAANSTSTPAYPDASDLYVRMLFRNLTGLGDATNATGYTLPNIPGAANGGVPLQQFIQTLESWSMGVSDWCSACSATNSFCPYYDPLQWGLTGSTSPSSNSGSVTPVVAGVIGAMVTLAVLLLLLAASMLFLGVRFRRNGGKRRAGGNGGVDTAATAAGGAGVAAAAGGVGGGHKRRKSDMGGFKGTEKLASDIDLPGTAALGEGGAAPGHTRTNSWEMKEGSKHASQMTAVDHDAAADFKVSPSAGIKFIRDEDDEQIESMKPVETRESV